MACEKCGGKADEVSKNIFFCRECGARQTSPEQQKPTGLLYLVIVLNYVMMVIFIAFGGLLSLSGLLMGGLPFLAFTFLGIILFFMAGVVFWVNLGLKKLDSSRRIYPIMLYTLITLIPFIGFFGISVMISPVFGLILTGLNLYALYMHKPTLELFIEID